MSRRSRIVASVAACWFASGAAHAAAPRPSAMEALLNNAFPVVLVGLIAFAIWRVVSRRGGRGKPAVVEEPDIAQEVVSAVASAPEGGLSEVGPTFFISHASADAETATALVRSLEARNVGCWIAPRDVPLGNSYGQAIADAVAHETEAVVVLVSEASETSAPVQSELELARRFNKTIIPIMLNGHEPAQKGTLYYIGTSQWLRFEGDGVAAVEALVRKAAA